MSYVFGMYWSYVFGMSFLRKMWNFFSAMSLSYVYGISFLSKKWPDFFGMSWGYVFDMSFFPTKMTYFFGMLFHPQKWPIFWYVSKLCFGYVMLFQKSKYFFGMFITYVLGMFWKMTYLKHTRVTYAIQKTYLRHTKNIPKILCG